MSRIGLAVLLALAVSACAADEPSSPVATPSPSPTPTPSASSSPTPTAERSPTPTPEPVATLIAVGDIAGCDVSGDEAVAALVATLDGTLATLGDHAYPNGSDATYADCYDPAWGEFLERTRPAPGNHDLAGDGGAAYWRYFADRAGTPGDGWYSYDLGDWHIVALNSNCELIACTPGSAQHDWLTDDLAASDARCTLAHMHHPLFSSGPYGGYEPVTPLWDALAADGAELLLAGHDHLYERFAPQTSAGQADANGIRQFIAGTGGFELYPHVRTTPNSEVAIDDAFGVLVLTLRPDAYDWSFLAADGTELDSGSGECR